MNIIISINPGKAKRGNLHPLAVYVRYFQMIKLNGIWEQLLIIFGWYLFPTGHHNKYFMFIHISFTKCVHTVHAIISRKELFFFDFLSFGL
jgi:hypothetical protein